MKKFPTYAKRRLRSLSNHLTAFGDTAEPEVLHKIRLEIKKIKALLNITEFCVKGFKGHKRYLPFRYIFRRAGEIRQADMVNELFQIHKIKPQQINGRSAAANRDLILSFQKELPSFFLSIKKKKASIITSFREVKHTCFKKYLDFQKKELQKKIFPRLNQRELHRTRKKIKEILYLSPIAKKSKEELDPFYDKLQILIGLWHDKQTVMTLLNASEYPIEHNALRAECRSDIKNIKALVRQFYGK